LGWNESDSFRFEVHRRNRMIKTGTVTHRIPLMVKNAIASEAAQTDLWPIVSQSCANNMNLNLVCQGSKHSNSDQGLLSYNKKRCCVIEIRTRIRRT
jgi:hypothetical protein